MTEEEVIKAIENLCDDIDPINHIIADSALYVFLKHLGYTKLAEEYDKVDKHYGTIYSLTKSNRTIEKKREVNIMTEEEAIVRIKEECFTGDEEIDHGNADDILCEFLKSLGYTKLVEVYKKVEKLYA